MHTQDAYNSWAKTYDTVTNKTRDLEGAVIQSVLGNRRFNRVLEIGCGTGKNTRWLLDRCEHLTAIDFSQEMMELARQKITGNKVRFVEADITRAWNFGRADLITCSLVLEHIRDLDCIFQQAAGSLNPGGLFYICEPHPYKQLQGGRARFEQDGHLLHLDYFIHHISDYFNASVANGFSCAGLQEWFDGEDRSQTPRLASYLFQQ